MKYLNGERKKKCCIWGQKEKNTCTCGPASKKICCFHTGALYRKQYIWNRNLLFRFNKHFSTYRCENVLILITWAESVLCNSHLGDSLQLHAYSYGLFRWLLSRLMRLKLVLSHCYLGAPWWVSRPSLNVLVIEGMRVKCFYDIFRQNRRMLFEILNRWYFCWEH